MASNDYNLFVERTLSASAAGILGCHQLSTFGVRRVR